VPQVNELDCSNAVCHTHDKAFSLGHMQPCPHKQTVDIVAMQPHTAPVCRIIVSTPVFYATKWIAYYSFTDPRGIQG